MTDLERLYISIGYRQSDIRRMLLSLSPDASNISDIADENNLPEEIIRHWYDILQRVFGAYRLDEYRNPGFVEAQIV
jgi:hypothetical protein